MKILIIISTVILTFVLSTVSGQTECDSLEFPKLINNSFQCNWTFIILEDTITGTIIKHEQQTVGCEVIATASLTIMKVKNDTIRIIDLCNNEIYEIGETVRIAPSSEPNFQVHIPSHILISGQKGKKKKTKKEKEEQNKQLEKELSTWHSNAFDKIVVKTTWGRIIK